VSVRGARLDIDAGYVAGRPPRERAFRGALDEDVARMEAFLDRPIALHSPPARDSPATYA